MESTLCGRISKRNSRMTDRKIWEVEAGGEIESLGVFFTKLTLGMGLAGVYNKVS